MNLLLNRYKEFHEYTKKNDKLNEQSFITFFEMLHHTTKNADNYYKLAFKGKHYFKLKIIEKLI